MKYRITVGFDPIVGVELSIHALEHHRWREWVGYERLPGCFDGAAAEALRVCGIPRPSAPSECTDGTMRLSDSGAMLSALIAAGDRGIIVDTAEKVFRSATEEDNT